MFTERIWTVSVFVLQVLSFSGSDAFRWTSSLQDGQRVVACIGDDIRLPWTYTLDGAETVLDVEWYLQRTGKGQGIYASYVAGHLLTLGLSVQRAQFLPNAGLLIHQATVDDAGVYSVHVNVHNNYSSPVALRMRSSDVIVAITPNISGNGLHVQQRPRAAMNQASGQWAVELECGRFSSLGQPPVDIQWTFPSGATVTHNLSQHANGMFVLALTDPAESGNYSCELSRDSPALTCLARDSPWREKASILVDGKDVKVSILEAKELDLMKRVQELEQEKKALANQTQACVANQNLLESAIQRLTNQTQSHETAGQATENGVQDKNQHPVSCMDALQYAQSSGVHTLFPSDQTPPIAVYCDQATDGGGWAVFQRRVDGSVDFYRDWTEYQRGFGSLDGEFWLGLESLHILTSTSRQDLRVDMTDWEGNHKYATYSGFQVADSSDNYRLHFDSFTGGQAGDSLSRQNGHQFSTPGADHDNDHNTDCATEYHGAWWFNNCHDSNLNGEYKHNSSAPHEEGVMWVTFRGFPLDFRYSLKSAEMKLRPSSRVVGTPQPIG